MALTSRVTKKVPLKKNPYARQGVAFGATFTLGVEAGNARLVSVQSTDSQGRAMTVRSKVFAYLSDDTNGDSLAAAAPSGGYVVTTDGLLIPIVANKASEFITEANGKFDITITEVGVKSFFLIVALADGTLKSSGAIAFA
jgi:hypothetical protein